MPQLKKMLQSYDIDLITRISQFWGIDITRIDSSSIVEHLFIAMLDRSLLEEIIASLPLEAKRAWGSLSKTNRPMTWANFTRKFGDVRVFGPARRKRESPETNPASNSEFLWYRGLIGRAFLDIPPEPQEYVFIPEELQNLLSPSDQFSAVFKINDVKSSMVKSEYPATSRVLDHITDWLSARRMDRPLPAETFRNWGIPETFISPITRELNLMDSQGILDAELLKTFFQTNREDLLKKMFDGWKESKKINDLRIVPGLEFEGTWQNDPVRARQFVLELLHDLQLATWYSLTSLVDGVKTRFPDFQRSAGDYDSWFIRQQGSGEYLRGFERWDDVEGALLTFLVTGPLHWLGMLDIGETTSPDTPTVFSLSKFAPMLLDNTVNKKLIKEYSKVKFTSDLSIIIPVFSSRLIRYQIGRFCEIKNSSLSDTRYQLTLASIRTAEEQGLKVNQLLQLLEKNYKDQLPGSFRTLLERWELNGLESTFEKRILLRVKQPEILKKIKLHPRASKLIVEELNPTTAIIEPQGVELLTKIFMEMGILSQVDLEV
jgi:hypothetical protein